MPNAKTQRQGPNATYIPLAGIGVLRWERHNYFFCVGRDANFVFAFFQIPTCWYPNAKFWRRGLFPNATPRRQNFASQWNIGLRD